MNTFITPKSFLVSVITPVFPSLCKLNIQLPYDPAIPLLGSHPREMMHMSALRLVLECS